MKHLQTCGNRDIKNLMVSELSKRQLGGVGELRGPVPRQILIRVFRLIEECLIPFSKCAIQQGIKNENGLNRMLSRFITSTARFEGLSIFANPESMEDETRGNSPSVDIGIFLYVDDSFVDPPKITIIEGKRLTRSTGPQRRREYVTGHERRGKYIACGGIERFKFGIHGREFDDAGIIGYLQDGTIDQWLTGINRWIAELADDTKSGGKWSRLEQLNGDIDSCSSIGRFNSITLRAQNQIRLIHLWVNLINHAN